ncbi:hypothetical protein [Planomicrobium sp. MB-3u-38]|uniref:hypothetical protein n=1 Tax=Planomicrobium sp. MB-3u-38 TaxID=2058318 RepID=UPI000C7BDCB3|nr:hypothetical protein [Planomicrobium sp. MB-3u-38]PKH11253.1 hypothetical protein CXF70_04985 [Planomicrobium sp. MB-3u-38]
MKKYNRWKKIYLFLMLFFYGIFVPVTAAEWLFSDAGFPFTAVVVGIGLPPMRKNHLAQLKSQASIQ